MGASIRQGAAMDWGYKAMLTAVTVALVLVLAQTIGRRLAGALAGLPVTTAPALLWIGMEQGPAFAAASAVGSIAACGVVAVFALAYERLSRRLGPAATLLASLAAAAFAALPGATLAGHPLRALLAAGTVCTLVLLLLPSGGPRAGQARRIRADIAVTAVVAGLTSAAVSVGASALGPFWAGLLASLPVIGAATLVAQHVRAPHEDIQRFLRGYVAGLLGKAVFASAFASAVVAIGAPLAMALALLVGATATFCAANGLTLLERRAAGRVAAT